MKGLYAWLGGMFLIGAILGGAYLWAYKRGEDAGYGLCRAEYQPLLEARDRKIEAFETEAAARVRAVEALKAAKQAEEAALKRQLQEQASAYEVRVQKLENILAGGRRELARLHDSLATARISTDSFLKPISATAGPTTDGASSVIGTVVGECAERRIEMGGLAAKLAEQVVGLQAYARLAQQACGGR